MSGLGYWIPVMQKMEIKPTPLMNMTTLNYDTRGRINIEHLCDPEYFWATIWPLSEEEIHGNKRLIIVIKLFLIFKLRCSH